MPSHLLYAMPSYPQPKLATRNPQLNLVRNPHSAIALFPHRRRRPHVVEAGLQPVEGARKFQGNEGQITSAVAGGSVEYIIVRIFIAAVDDNLGIFG